MGIVQPTRGRSPRLHVILNPQNPQKPGALKELWLPASCLCVCLCVNVGVVSSLEPQLNLSDISSHVLFPYYKGPTVTHRVRVGTTDSYTNAHILISTLLHLCHAHTHSDTHQRE